MLVLINRSVYVEVRHDKDTIFRKNKPSMGLGISGMLLALLDIRDRGVYVLRTASAENNEKLETLIQFLHPLDGRVPEDMHSASEVIAAIAPLVDLVEKVE